MVGASRIFKILYSFGAVLFFAMSTIAAIADNWEMAVLFGLGAIVLSLWEIVAALDILIAKDDAK